MIVRTVISRTPLGTVEKPPSKRAPCIHLGDLIPESRQKCHRRRYVCAIFNVCTLTSCDKATRACSRCERYEVGAP